MQLCEKKNIHFQIISCKHLFSCLNTRKSHGQKAGKMSNMQINYTTRSPGYPTRNAQQAFNHRFSP